MLQKIFRLIALFFFIALILSPIYFKHIRHYIRTINLVSYDVENITESFFSKEDINRYRCKAGSHIKTPSANNVLQILHFSSPKCYACVSEVDDWRNLPVEIYKTLSSSNKQYQNKNEIEIVNILNENLINEKNTKDFVHKMMTFSEQEGHDDLYEKIASANISTCLIGISESEITDMNIEILPYSLVIKNGEIIYALAGQMSAGEIDRLVGIINQNINK